MKLFLWDDVLTDYEDGVMFAIAPDLKKAKEVILATGTEYQQDSFRQWLDTKEPKILPLDQPFGFHLNGSA